ncbi:MAG: hypothetical protein FJ317_04130 [SAR202 cluster bacterium]|nr:hypothetical protein [SAR202 cluster bacterium]
MLNLVSGAIQGGGGEIPILRGLTTLEVVLVVVVVVVLLGAVTGAFKAFRDWVWRKMGFGSTGPRPSTTLTVMMPPDRTAYANGMAVVARLQQQGTNNPVPAQNVTFTIEEGTRSGITSQFSTGGTNVVVPTDANGDAKVQINGTGAGSDRVRIKVGLSDQPVDYETTNTNRP